MQLRGFFPVLFIVTSLVSGQSNNVIENDDCTIHFDVWVGEGCYDDGDDFYPSLTLDIPAADSCGRMHPWITTFGDEIVDDAHMHAILDILDGFLDHLCENPLAASVLIDYEDNTCVELPTVYGDIYMVGRTCEIGEDQVISNTQQITYEEADENAEDNEHAHENENTNAHDSGTEATSEEDAAEDSRTEADVLKDGNESAATTDSEREPENSDGDDNEEGEQQLSEEQIQFIRDQLIDGNNGEGAVNVNDPYNVYNEGNNGGLGAGR